MKLAVLLVAVLAALIALAAPANAGEWPLSSIDEIALA
jgi:hypothetical protein